MKGPQDNEQVIVMTILQRLVRLLVFTVLVIGGILSFMLAFSADKWDGPVNLLRTAAPLEFWVGLGLFSLALLFAGTGIRRQQREKFLSFENENGRVSISTIAIADHLAKLSAEFPAIVRMHPKVVPSRNTIDIIVDLKVRAGSQVHEVCELLQQRIRESMISDLGISQVRRVEVNVKEIVLEHRPG